LLLKLPREWLPGKYPGYNFYRVAGLAIGGKAKGEAENEAPPVDVKSLLP
jgi:NADH-quinone oxidoreductase subunit I